MRSGQAGGREQLKSTLWLLHWEGVKTLFVVIKKPCIHLCQYSYWWLVSLDLYLIITGPHICGNANAFIHPKCWILAQWYSKDIVETLAYFLTYLINFFWSLCRKVSQKSPPSPRTWRTRWTTCSTAQGPWCLSVYWKPLTGLSLMQLGDCHRKTSPRTTFPWRP